MNGSCARKALAEEVEKGGNKGQAAELYGQAAQLFEAENSTSEASKCRQKVGGPALLDARPHPPCCMWHTGAPLQCLMHAIAIDASGLRSCA